MESQALRNLRISLRITAEDCRDLEAQIKYGVIEDAEAFERAREVGTNMLNDVAVYDDARP